MKQMMVLSTWVINLNDTEKITLDMNKSKKSLAIK